MSESGYNTVDLHLNYQYRPSACRGWLQARIAEDLVVAPYATVRSR
jgi:cyclic beta-1,2-glucan synthetase